MHLKRTTLFLSLAAAAGCTNAVDTNGSLEPATSTITAELSAGSSLALQNVVSANPKAAGFWSPNILSPQLIESPVAQGLFAAREPPDGHARRWHHGDSGLLRLRRQRPAAAGRGRSSRARPTRSRPARPSPTRTPTSCSTARPAPMPSYDYGTHFLFQGHETGTPGYITRINLDADGAHRVTLMAATDVTGAPIADIDGSTWDPFAQRLIFTTENCARRSRVPGDAGLPVGRRGHLGRDRARRLRRRPERLGRQPLDRRGRRRLQAGGHPARQGAEQLRLPLRAEAQGQPQGAASCRSCRSRRSAPACRLSSRHRRAQRTTSGRPAHLRQLVRDHLGDDPRHRRRRHRAVRRQRRRQGQAAARRSSGRRTASSTRARSSRSSSSTRPATPTRAPRPARRSAASAACSS